MVTNIIKEILRVIFKLCALIYPYVIILGLTNAKDEFTIINIITAILYSIIAINLFEWVFEN